MAISSAAMSYPHVQRSAVAERLSCLLDLDKAFRQPSPISLPGRPAVFVVPEKQAPPPPVGRVQASPKHYRPIDQWEEGDGVVGCFTRSELLRMDERFSSRLEKCFREGTEHRSSARGVMRRSRSRA